ncbi:MAG: methionyl-tRNA formyltransferase [Planctomycetota bacterium]|jgi:methionyl-tRNA formyltransferase
MKVVFMGTPEIARDILAYLVKSRHDVLAVVTRPDRARGRSKKPLPSPVKELAQEKGLEVLQPENAGAPELVTRLKEVLPDAIIVAAYGHILKESLLNLPPKGCINIHGSLLPKYRGASPIASAIAAGETETGVTLQYMAPKCDTGEMISQRAIPVEESDTTGTLSEKLALIGGQMIVDLLNRIESGEEISCVKQDEANATMTCRLQKSDGEIKWSRSAIEIERHIRAMQPWPAAFTFIETVKGRPPLRITLHTAEVEETESTEEPGTILECSDECIRIATGKGTLSVTELQVAGKKRMKTGIFLRGTKLMEGMRFING